MVYTNKLFEELFNKYQPVIGDDLPRYKNHVYRVFLNCLLLDRDHANQERYAYAALFHDIGIWTDHTIDYLQPSIAQACEYLANNGKKELIADITLMIFWHHKITSYSGPAENIVEVFRKADWIDVSLGVLSFGVDKREIRKNQQLFPNYGFHAFLLKKLVKNFFIHPFHPLPMFRK